VRFLKLTDEVRLRHGMSSLRCAIHAAAPCPIPVKEKMIEWWGPIVWEYYGGTEGNGLTMCNATDWLAHKGTVGRAVLGTVKICDEAGNELPRGEAGTIYFADGRPFAYHNDPQKTAETKNAQGWTTLGDVGYVDADGFLHLTDRKAFMIISGGVNVYPQETEDVLIAHPEVADAAVLGVPDAEMGEQVKAVIQPRDRHRHVVHAVPAPDGRVPRRRPADRAVPRQRADRDPLPQPRRQRLRVRVRVLIAGQRSVTAGRQ